MSGKRGWWDSSELEKAAHGDDDDDDDDSRKSYVGWGPEDDDDDDSRKSYVGWGFFLVVLMLLWAVDNWFVSEGGFWWILWEFFRLL